VLTFPELKNLEGGGVSRSAEEGRAIRGLVKGGQTITPIKSRLKSFLVNHHQPFIQKVRNRSGNLASTNLSIVGEAKEPKQE